jgi:two-component system, sensor histidine kinase and response regulator
MKSWLWSRTQKIYNIFWLSSICLPAFVIICYLSWKLTDEPLLLFNNWLCAGIVIGALLRSSSVNSRIILLSYFAATLIVDLRLSAIYWQGLCSTTSSLLFLSIVYWLFRKDAPLVDEHIDQTLLLRLILICLGVAAPIGLLIGASLFWSASGNWDWPSLFRSWLYNGLGILLFLIPCLKISLRRLKTAFSFMGVKRLLYFIVASCGICFALSSLLINPFIYIAILLALLALNHSAFFVATWTLGTLFLAWILILGNWIPTPGIFLIMSSDEIFSSTVVTVFFLQLIGFLSELMSKSGKKLVQSETRMRGALEFAATGFALISTQGEILEANACLCRMLGYSKEELKGLTANEISHPDDRLRSKSNLEAIQRGDIDNYEFEKRYICKDGHVIWVNVRLSLLNYSSTQPKELILQVDNITQRKEAEGELLHKETRLKLALAAANAGAWEWDLVDSSTWWADEIYSILRLAPGVIPASQEKWLATIHPEDRARVQKHIQHAVSHGAGYQETYRLIREDGSTAWIEDYADVELDTKGQVSRVFGISQDVTERTLIELAVQHSESRLRAILNCAVDAIITMDSHGRIHSFNPSAEKMFGYLSCEILGEDISILIPSPHKERHHSYINRYLRTGMPHIIGQSREIQALHKSGRLIPIELTVTEVENQGERFFTGMLRDISAHKQAEAALISARSELQSVINAASEISIIASTPEGVITLFNSGAERMLGYSAADIIGIRTPVMFHDMNEVVSRSIELTNLSGKAITGFAVLVYEAIQHGFEAREWIYIRKNGSRLTVLLTITPIRDADGIITGFLGIAKDITPLKITQAELYRAKIQAEQANKAKSEFLANMSHEIRTPLNAVLGIAFLLGNTSLDISQKQYVKMISGAGRSLLLILNDILDFSKIEAGRMDISLVEFSLDEMLDELASIMSVNAADKDLDLLISVQPEVPRILMGDGMRLQQILINLAGNAIKFTQKGHVSLQIALETASADMINIRFTVLDTGIGMSQQQQERLFQPFSQADNSMTRKYGGTGLGLAISKRLVELMNGSIGVKSQLDCGSEFWFCLPFSPIHHATTSPVKYPLKALQVLVLDDNQVLMESVTLAIESLGWGVTQASTVAEAKTKLDAAEYDLLLLGWPLQKENGLQLLEQSDCWNKTIPIALTRLHQKENLYMDPLSAKLSATLVQPITGSSVYNAVLEARSQRAGSPDELIQQLVPKTFTTSALADVSVLLVEDNEINQMVACRILEQEGANVEVVNNGQEAITRMKQPNEFAVILMDVQMPVMDGYTATRILRQELGIMIPILAMTAGVMNSEQEQCRQSGMNDIIAKPVDVTQMLSCIKRHLQLELTDPLLATTALHTAEQALNLVPLRQTFGDDDPLIAQLLMQFQSETRQFHEQLECYLADQDLAAAARLVHTLKGHAGTFGSARLANQAREIELAIREKRSAELVMLLPELFESLDELHHAIAFWLARQEGKKINIAPLSEHEFHEQMHNLEYLLQEHNIAALDQFDVLRVALAQRCELAQLNTLIAAIEALDFQLAAQLLNQLNHDLPD